MSLSRLPHRGSVAVRVRAAARPSLRATAVAVSLLALSPVAFAQSVLADAPRLALANPAALLDPVVITGSRTPQRVDEVLADVSVIERPQIERLGVAGLADLLARLSGVQFGRNGGPGGTTSLYLRGTDSRHTLLLIDGVRVESQSTGGAPWEALPLSEIERVEVLRGPASALYGSDAIGGVVQVFTRRPGGPARLSLGLGAGSQGARKSELSVSGTAHGLDLALGAGAEESKGFNQVPDPADLSHNPDRDGFRSYHAHLRAGLQLAPGHRLEGGVLGRDVRAQYDAFFSGGADDVSRHRLDSGWAAWAATWAPGWTSRVQAGQSDERYRTDPQTYSTRTRARTLSAQTDRRVGDSRWQLLAERREDRLVNDDVAADQDRRTLDGLGLGWHHRAGALTLQAQLRQDRDSDFGSHRTGGLAAGWKLDEAWRVHASAGTAFRAPTLYQRYSPYGNAALDPERSRNLEVGAAWQAGDSAASLVTWTQSVQDLIGFGDAGVCASPYGCYRNTSEATLRGLSLNGSTRWARVNLSGTLDWLKARDDGNGKELARRAPRSLLLRADTAVGDWTFGADLTARSARWSDTANTVRLGGFTTVDLDARWRADRDWTVQFTLADAGDRAPETAAGYPGPGRSAFVMLRWTPPLR